MKNKNWIEEWATRYINLNKLPDKMIPCSTEGCTVKTTCCSTNLKNRVIAHPEGVRGLLRDFKCRSCRTQSRSTDETLGTEEKPRLARAAKATKRTTTKAAAKQSRIEQLNEAAKSATIDVNAVPIKYNFEDPEAVRQLTEGSCQRPDIYLDNDRACDGCSLYEHCACASKQLLADSGRRKVVAGPRRKK